MVDGVGFRRFQGLEFRVEGFGFVVYCFLILFKMSS